MTGVAENAGSDVAHAFSVPCRHSCRHGSPPPYGQLGAQEKTCREE